MGGMEHCDGGVRYGSGELGRCEHPAGHDGPCTITAPADEARIATFWERGLGWPPATRGTECKPPKVYTLTSGHAVGPLPCILILGHAKKTGP